MSSLLGIAAGGPSSFYGFDVTNSLRFDDDSNTYLDRTPSSGGNRQIWTWSAWVKRADLGTQQVLFMAGTASTSRTMVYFETDNTLRIYIRESGVNLGRGSGTSIGQVSSSVFRDTSAWYHIVVAFDTTQADASSPLRADANRLKFYVNSVQQTNDTSHTFANSAISQNANTLVNHTVEHAIGHIGYDESSDFDGYLAEVNLIDGTQLAPTSFGETKSGVWIPKDTSGLTFGTNGFRLKFNDSGDIGNNANSTDGTNDYTPNNFSAHDVMPDSPTNNFATLNPQIGRALSDSLVDPRHGNLEIDTSNSGRGTTFSTMAMPTGTGEKYYAEYRYRADSGNMKVGIISVDDAADYRETDNFSDLAQTVSYTSVNGIITSAGSTVETVATFGVGDVIGIAVDLENGTCQFSKNGSNVGSAVSASFISSNQMLFACGDSSNSADIRYSANFGQDSTFAGDETAATNTDTNGIGAFHSAVPSGFKALCAKNLPETTITPKDDDIPEDYFNTVLYEGDGTAIGSGGQAVTGVGFQPDWVWIKNRDASDNHALYDVVRGVTKQIETDPDTPAVETTESEGLTAFGANGFTVGSLAQVNTNNESFVSWNWLAGGSASSNTAGDIDSSVSANTKPGFSIVGYTGDGTDATRTIGCGLTKKPEMVILKNRTEDSVTDSWFVWHQAFGTASPSKYMTLYNTDAVAASGVFVDSSFSDNSGNALFAVNGGYNGVNKSGTTYVAYCFNSIEGYSKFGGYTGNGDTDGQYIYTGFRPAFVIIKQSSASGNNWNMHDNKRDVDNVVDARLLPSTSGAETTFTTLDFLSNGFKLRNSGTAYNGSGSTYIYMAFAEMPFKYANAR